MKTVADIPEKYFDWSSKPEKFFCKKHYENWKFSVYKNARLSA